jgi:hypothetical protein
MELSLTTPALLFSTLSLMMLAYTNRYLALANRIRNLHDQFKETGEVILKAQIQSLRHRVSLIKYMQAAGIGSLLGTTICMFLLFFEFTTAGQTAFGISLFLLIVSLLLSLREIFLSVRALDLHLQDIADNH